VLSSPRRSPRTRTQLHQQMIVDLVARNRLAASYPAREFVEAGD